MTHRLNNGKWELQTTEDPETGEMIIEFPPDLIKELGWIEGDDLDFRILEDGPGVEVINITWLERNKLE
jgi:hypothetical protein